MAVAAEQQQSETQIHAHETYAASLGTVRRLGECAVKDQLGSESGQNVYRLAYADFVTSIEENLKTDVEFRKWLDVDTAPRIDNIINGQVCAADGTPMQILIARGLDCSRAAAEDDPRMDTQVIRDEGDLANAVAVDAMPVGSSRIVISMEPKMELQSEPVFWHDLGYREGIAYIQTYSKTTNSVVARACSVDLSDESTWRTLFAEYGVEIPHDESPNTWIRNAIEIKQTPTEVKEFVSNLRERYYQLTGASDRRRSVSDYVAAHSTMLEAMFTSHYQSVCSATYTRRKNAVVHNFGQTLIQKSDDLNPEMRSQLIKIINSDKFDDNASRFMEAAVRYGVVEQLRKGLGAYCNPDCSPERTADLIIPLAQVSYDASVQLCMQQLNIILANNIGSGARAGRTYGGCSSQFSPGKSAINSTESSTNNQETYGGAGSNDAENSDESTNGVCEYEHKNCYCCPYDDEGRPTNVNRTVRARRDTSGAAHCLRSGCGAAIDAKGKTLSIGRIAEKARMRRQQYGNIVKVNSDNTLQSPSIDRSRRNLSGKLALSAV